jgi:nitrogen regulatory protein PII
MLNDGSSARFREQRTLGSAPAMKKVEAIVRPTRLGAVRDALERRGVGGLTVTDVKGAGRENGRTMCYRGTSYTVDFINKVKVEVVVPEADATAVAYAIVEAARTGRVGDGLVFITPVVEAIRIRTGERGPNAVTHGPLPSEHEPLAARVA